MYRAIISDCLFMNHPIYIAVLKLFRNLFLNFHILGTLKEANLRYIIVGEI